MIKKKKPSEGGGNWMDTYGDMVTLLMTFFVMLYSMSNINQQKWEAFVRSIYPNSSEEATDQVIINGEVGDSDSVLEGSVDVPELEEITPETLYLTLAQKLEELGTDGVTLSRGSDYTFITFQNSTFFEGDSYRLTKEGEKVLDVFCEVVEPAKDMLAQINIMGYTSQGNPDVPNNPRVDRTLSSMRAAEVCIYIQLKDVVDPAKLVTIGYGQFRPVDTFETEEGRARNRRVELLLIDEGADVRSMNEYYEEYLSGINADTTIFTGEGEGFETTEPTQEGMSTRVYPESDEVAAEADMMVDEPVDTQVDLEESINVEEATES